MISKYILLIFFIFFYNKLYSQEAPKKIIVIEENLELENNDINQNNKKSKNAEEIYLEEYTLEEAMNLIKNNKIIDQGTISALNIYKSII